ncbi:MAG: carboxypeptidase-like regulatory domain-containing protein, partial [Vicinamibacterales bacterium]
MGGRVTSKLIGAVVVLVMASCAPPDESMTGLQIDADDIGGIVTSAAGSEAGVWVIAETMDLPTRFIRIVSTDDDGQYVLPDLPEATYEVFVRGYGLVDSERVNGTPGQMLNLDAVVAPDAVAAAQVYPAAWWLSMMELPEGDLSHQELGSSVTGCMNCHQVGNKATREILPGILSESDSHFDAWDQRVQMGPMGAGMNGMYRRLGPQREMFANWTDRIASGEAPTQTPPRPTGIERNIVVTLWDWGTETDGRTDSTPSDVRDATVNANGLVYGVVQPSDILAVLDPVEHRATNITIPSDAPPILSETPTSPYYGDEPIWARRSDPRSVAMDGTGKVWLTGRVRGADEQPSFCTDSENAFADYFPIERGTRQAFMYDPETEEFSEIDTCFSADHNQLGEDERFYYGFRDGVGWIDVEIWEETQDAEASQGWCPTVLDTNGDGMISQGWTEPDESVDPTLDHRIAYGCYSPAYNKADGTVWCSDNGRDDNTLMRLQVGDNPPESCVAEVYMPPPSIQNPSPYGSGGLHITNDGLVWQDWRGSGHFASFDRSVCTVTNGPEATGQSCSEGWSFYRMDKPTYA